MGKKIILLIHSTPYREMNNYEVLRASLSLIDHQVSVAWIGEGVFFPLRTSEKGNTQQILSLLKEMGVKLLVDSDQLRERGYGPQDLASFAEPVSHPDLVTILSQADSVLSF